MVIGYLSCLLAPGYFKMEQKEQLDVKQIEVAQNLTISSVTSCSFTQIIQQAENVNNDNTIEFYTTVNEILGYPPISLNTSNGISFQLFSRPPPSQNC
jgi:hypothetical protein